MQTISIALTIAFTIIAMLHLAWALGVEFDIRNVVPFVDGQPLFTPGPAGTFVVAIVLFGFAAVSLGLGFPALVPDGYGVALRISGSAIGIILLIRAVGDFKHAGFFKRMKGSRFAKYDTWLYSPFCFLSGLALLFLANQLT